MQSLHLITGQTATGKTSRALAHAHEHGGEIISADARQMYEHLTCITGKDVGKSEFVLIQELPEYKVGYYEVEGIRIWGYDLLTPDQPASSSLYVSYVTFILAHTMDKRSTPIVVGGSYLYIQDLLYGISAPVDPDWDLRRVLEHVTVEELQGLLHKQAPEIFEALNDSDRHNPRRLMRRLEIVQSGIQQTPQNTSPRYAIQSFTGLRHVTDELLRERIRARVIERFDHGALEEIRDLIKLGYSPQSPGCTATGYAQMFAFQAGEISREEAIDLWTTAEVRYAKRQLSFMKKNPSIQWAMV